MSKFGVGEGEGVKGGVRGEGEESLITREAFYARRQPTPLRIPRREDWMAGCDAAMLRRPSQMMKREDGNYKFGRDSFCMREKEVHFLGD